MPVTPDGQNRRAEHGTPAGGEQQRTGLMRELVRQCGTPSGTLFVRAWADAGADSERPAFAAAEVGSAVAAGVVVDGGLMWR